MAVQIRETLVLISTSTRVVLLLACTQICTTIHTYMSAMDPVLQDYSTILILGCSTTTTTTSNGVDSTRSSYYSEYSSTVRTSRVLLLVLLLAS
jgi:hypothetical protein